MSFKSPVTLVHAYLRTTVLPGDIVVDATVGNGNDTLVLASLVGPTGTVYGFDVQPIALDVTKAKLERAGMKATLFCESHDGMVHMLPPDVRGTLRACCFNLGYLPGGDKSITTHVASTISAVRAAYDMLADTGLITIVAYQHDEGRVELAELRRWLPTLSDATVNVVESTFINRDPSSPVVFAIMKTTEPLELPVR